MKILRFCLAIAFLVGNVSLTMAEQVTPNAGGSKDNAIGSNRIGGEARKIELAIDADRNKIIEESKAIAADHKKIKETARLVDKTAAGQVAQEMSKDIETRESVIRGLKKDISDMKIRKNHLVYGDQVIPKRTHETP